MHCLCWVLPFLSLLYIHTHTLLALCIKIGTTTKLAEVHSFTHSLTLSFSHLTPHQGWCQVTYGPSSYLPLPIVWPVSGNRSRPRSPCSFLHKLRQSQAALLDPIINTYSTLPFLGDNNASPGHLGSYALLIHHIYFLFESFHSSKPGFSSRFNCY